MLTVSLADRAGLLADVPAELQPTIAGERFQRTHHDPARTRQAWPWLAGCGGRRCHGPGRDLEPCPPDGTDPDQVERAALDRDLDHVRGDRRTDSHEHQRLARVSRRGDALAQV